MGKRKHRKVEEVASSASFGNEKSACAADESDADDDDEFPCALSPAKKKLGNEFKRGDLVFAKFKSYPYWPGLFFAYSTSKKKKKAKIYFFEAVSTECITDDILPISLDHIRSFSCPEKERIVKAGMKGGAEFEKGWERAQDYLRKRACDKIKDFFEQVKEKDDVSEDEDQESARPTTSSIGEFNEPESTKKKESPSFRKALLFEMRKSKRQQGKRCKDLLEWIYKNGRALLKDITDEKKISLRHKTFVSAGRQSDKDGLKWISGYGPIGDTDEAERLSEILVLWKKEDYPHVTYNPISYVSEVWLPEVIIHSISSVKNISYAQAEDKFLNGS